MHDQVGAIKGSGEESLVALELQFVRHDVTGVRQHAVRGNNHVAFDAQRHLCVAPRYSEIVCTTLETGRELTVGSFRSLTMSSSYWASVCTGALARIATTL